MSRVGCGPERAERRTRRPPNLTDLVPTLAEDNRNLAEVNPNLAEFNPRSAENPTPVEATSWAASAYQSSHLHTHRCHRHHLRANSAPRRPMAPLESSLVQLWLGRGPKRGPKKAPKPHKIAPRVTPLLAEHCLTLLCPLTLFEPFWTLCCIFRGPTCKHKPNSAPRVAGAGALFGPRFGALPRVQSSTRHNSSGAIGRRGAEFALKWCR